MVTEISEGIGSNMLGALSKVESEYKLSKGTELVAVKGASCTTRGNKVVVTTEYSSSMQFNIVVREEGVIVSYPFIHTRHVKALAGRTDINSRQPAKRARPVKEVVELPGLVELNVAAPAALKVGFDG